VIYTQSKTLITRINGKFCKLCGDKLSTSPGKIRLSRYKSKVAGQNGKENLNTMENIKRLLSLAHPERRKIAGKALF